MLDAEPLGRCRSGTHLVAPEWLADVRWGTLPEAITAIATLGGFGYGLVLLKKQLQAYEAAEEERKESDRRRARSEIERHERHVRAVGVSAEPVRGGDIHYLSVRVTNDFSAPMHNCLVRLYGHDGERLADPIVYGTVGNGVAEKKLSAPPGHAVANADVIFFDYLGTNWRKTAQGRFEEIKLDVRDES